MLTMDGLRAFIETKTGAPVNRSFIVWDRLRGELSHTCIIEGRAVRHLMPIEPDMIAPVFAALFPGVPSAFDFAAAGLNWNDRRAELTIYANGTRRTYHRTY